IGIIIKFEKSKAKINVICLNAEVSSDIGTCRKVTNSISAKAGLVAVSKYDVVGIKKVINILVLIAIENIII
ncbi:hypothetical protein, partial [Aliarcobacter butzleri]|uniref:hypothetical protein n=1 Tax=Aliarcobacter butzleri TaxID=28197 RepID=UPI003B21648B